MAYKTFTTNNNRDVHNGMRGSTDGGGFKREIFDDTDGYEDDEDSDEDD